MTPTTPGLQPYATGPSSSDASTQAGDPWLREMQARLRMMGRGWTVRIGSSQPPSARQRPPGAPPVPGTGALDVIIGSEIAAAQPAGSPPLAPFRPQPDAPQSPLSAAGRRGAAVLATMKRGRVTGGTDDAPTSRPVGRRRVA